MNAVAPAPPPPPSIMAAFIASLRQNAPFFAGNVAGAADFYRGLRNYETSAPMPAAYVRPLGQEAEPNKTYGGLVQIVHKEVGVCVQLDAQRDRRGQDPTMSFELIEQQIMASCLNLYIGECRMTQGVYFTSSGYLDLDRARLWYEWRFGLDWQISDADGVQFFSTPLQSIEVDFFGPDGVPPVGTMPAAVVVLSTSEDDPPPPTNGGWPSTARARWPDLRGVSRIFRRG